MAGTTSRYPAGLAGDFNQFADIAICRNSLRGAGPLGSLQVWAMPHTVIYCGLWSDTDRSAFWTGFADRAKEIGEDFLQLWQWVVNAIGLGDEDGDFGKAWSSFGAGVTALAEVGWKILVVLRIPPVMAFHPDRERFAEELKALGIQLGSSIGQGYKAAYAAGGISQVVGRLFADVLAIVFEIVATKGLGKGVKSLRLVEKLPPTMRSKLDEVKNYALLRGTIKIASAGDAGMTAVHFEAVKQLAMKPGNQRIIFFRPAKAASEPYIRRGFPAKPKELEFVKTNEVSGVVTCGSGSDVAKARNTVHPGSGKKYYTVDMGGKTATNGDGDKLILDQLGIAEWKPQVGQVIDPVKKLPVVSDYDLYDVVDVEVLKGSKKPNQGNMSLAVSDGKFVDNFSSPEDSQVIKELNAALQDERVKHGPWYKYAPPQKKELIIGFMPNGEVLVFNRRAIKNFYKYELGIRKSLNLKAAKEGK